MDKSKQYDLYTDETSTRLFIVLHDWRKLDKKILHKIAFEPSDVDLLDVNGKKSNSIAAAEFDRLVAKGLLRKIETPLKFVIDVKA